MQTKKLTHYLAELALAVGVSACGSKDQGATADATSGDTLTTGVAETDQEEKISFDVSSEEAKPETPAVREPEPQKPAEKPKPRPPATVTLTANTGSPIEFTLSDTLESGKAQTGQSFAGTLSSAIVVDGRTMFPAGATVEGVVIESIESGRLKGDAILSITLTSIDGQAVVTDTLTRKGAAHSDRNAKIIGGAAVVGGIIGALKGKDAKGAAIGAAAGAAAGTGVAAATGKRNAKIDAGEQVMFTLEESVSVTVPK